MSHFYPAFVGHDSVVQCFQVELWMMTGYTKFGHIETANFIQRCSYSCDASEGLLFFILNLPMITTGAPIFLKYLRATPSRVSIVQEENFVINDLILLKLPGWIYGVGYTLLRLVY